MSVSAKARVRAGTGANLTVWAGAVVGLAMTSFAAGAEENGLPFGRAALPEEVAAWDIDIRPDGAGLPEASARGIAQGLPRKFFFRSQLPLGESPVPAGDGGRQRSRLEAMEAPICLKVLLLAAL